jgi:uncharacterized protein (DUF952 family)
LALIFHILTRADWRDALQRGRYEPPSLRAEGFIHASTSEQALETANRFFRGAPDLLLLSIDTARLTAELRFEPPIHPGDARAAQLFPHIYGPLNLDAVMGAAEFPCNADGTFLWPPELTSSCETGV